MSKTDSKILKKFLAENEKLMDRKLYDVPLDALIPDPEQPRKHFDKAAIDELKVSIEKHEVLQPVIFRQDEEGGLVLVSGERRYRASQLAQKKTIPAIYIANGNATEIALVENLIRENLTVIEEAEGLLKLQETQGYNGEQLSAVIGKGVSTISEILSLNQLPESIKNECRSSTAYSRRALVEIVKIGTLKEMESLFKEMKDGGLKSDDIRAKTRKKKDEDPLSVIWEKRVEKFRKSVDKLSIEKLGNGRELVGQSLCLLADTLLEKAKACK